MNKQPKDISINEAQAALDSIAEANRIACKSVTPPFWFRILTALLISALTIFAAWSSGSSLWTFVLMITLAFVILIFVSYYWVLRNKGIKLLLNSKNKIDKVINFVGSFVTAILLMASIELYREGYTLMPHAVAFINFIVVLYLMSKYSLNGAQVEQGR